MATLDHVHLFICRRAPDAHFAFVPCRIYYVICPLCGSAGETVRLVPELVDG